MIKVQTNKYKFASVPRNHVTKEYKPFRWKIPHTRVYPKVSGLSR